MIVPFLVNVLSDIETSPRPLWNHCPCHSAGKATLPSAAKENIQQLGNYIYIIITCSWLNYTCRGHLFTTSLYMRNQQLTHVIQYNVRIHVFTIDSTYGDIPIAVYKQKYQSIWKIYTLYSLIHVLTILVYVSCLRHVFMASIYT